jgi:hypothetical protein
LHLSGDSAHADWRFARPDSEKDYELIIGHTRLRLEDPAFNPCEQVRIPV